MEREPKIFFSWSIGVGKESAYRSELDFHYFLIGVDDFVADLQEHVELQTGLLIGQDSGVEFTLASVQETFIAASAECCEPSTSWMVD